MNLRRKFHRILLSVIVCKLIKPRSIAWTYHLDRVMKNFYSLRSYGYPFSIGEEDFRLDVLFDQPGRKKDFYRRTELASVPLLNVPIWTKTQSPGMPPVVNLICQDNHWSSKWPHMMFPVRAIYLKSLEGSISDLTWEKYVSSSYMIRQRP